MNPPVDPSEHDPPGAPERSGAAHSRRYGRVRIALALGVVVGAVLWVLLALFGGFLIVAPDPLPPRADVAVSLFGSRAGTEARLSEAIRLLREGRVDNVLVAVPAGRYWGEWVPDLVRDFVGKRYEDVARSVVVCEMTADSTLQEAASLQRCLADSDWRSIVVVTSNYHTRRAGLVWKATVAERLPGRAVTVHGVSDGTFAVDGWWRRGLYARTWLLETTKLLWYFVESGSQS